MDWRTLSEDGWKDWLAAASASQRRALVAYGNAVLAGDSPAAPDLWPPAGNATPTASTRTGDENMPGAGEAWGAAQRGKGQRREQKMTPETVRAFQRRVFVDGASVAQACREAGICKSTGSDIKRGRLWATVRWEND